MGCIYIGVCSSPFALFLWQQVTNLAAVMAHCVISPSRYGSLSKLGLFSNSLWICVIWGKYVSLIWLCIWQEVRKCSSVSTSFCGHSLSSLESQVCLRWPFSIAWLCSLSLYIVNAFLKFGSVTVVRYSATVYSLFRAKNNYSLLCCFFPMCQVILFLFSHDLVGSNWVAVLGLCLYMWTEPQDQLA